MTLLILVACAMAITQLFTVFHFRNHVWLLPARGLKVGQRIASLRQHDLDQTHQPVLIEVVYWEYLAIHVGANDVTHLVYDRPLDLDKRKSLSLLVSDMDAFRSCLSRYDIGILVIKSNELKQLVENDLVLQSSEQINGYSFYYVPKQLRIIHEADRESCPLEFGRGYSSVGMLLRNRHEDL